MAGQPPRRRRRPNYTPMLLVMAVILAAVLVVLCIVAASLSERPDPTNPTDHTGTSDTAPTDPSKPTDPPTEPPTDPPTEPPTEPPTMPPTEPNTSGGAAVWAPPTVSKRDPSDPSFFDDAAFLGDSVTMALRNYNVSTKALGKATFLCIGSYAVRHAIDIVGGNNVVSITYQGKAMRPEDALAACGAKKVFIMLGMNDIGLLGVDKTIQNWGILVQNIRSKCPDIEIYIQSGTPIYIGGEKRSLNNKNMDAYNVKLKAFAEENGCYFVDVAMYMKDANGGLAAEYCSDNYVHFTNAGSSCWAKVLRAFVGD